MSLCNSIQEKICTLGLTGTDIHKESIETCQNYKKLFSKYDKCHNMIKKNNEFTQEEIQELGE